MQKLLNYGPFEEMGCAMNPTPGPTSRDFTCLYSDFLHEVHLVMSLYMYKFMKVKAHAIQRPVPMCCSENVSATKVPLKGFATQDIPDFVSTEFQQNGFPHDM